MQATKCTVYKIKYTLLLFSGKNTYSYILVQKSKIWLLNIAFVFLIGWLISQYAKEQNNGKSYVK